MTSASALSPRQIVPLHGHSMGNIHTDGSPTHLCRCLLQVAVRLEGGDDIDSVLPACVDGGIHPLAVPLLLRPQLHVPYDPLPIQEEQDGWASCRMCAHPCFSPIPVHHLHVSIMMLVRSGMAMLLASLEDTSMSTSIKPMSSVRACKEGMKSVGMG